MMHRGLTRMACVVVVAAVAADAAAAGGLESCRVTVVGDPSNAPVTHLMLGDEIVITARFAAPPTQYLSVWVDLNEDKTQHKVFMRKIGDGKVRSSVTIGIGAETKALKAIAVKPGDTLTFNLVLGNDDAVIHQMQLTVVSGRRVLPDPPLAPIHVVGATPMEATCILLAERQKQFKQARSKYDAAEKKLIEETQKYLQAQSRLKDDPTELVGKLEALSRRADAQQQAAQAYRGARQGVETAHELLAGAERALAEARANVWLKAASLRPAQPNDAGAKTAAALIDGKRNAISNATFAAENTLDVESAERAKASIRRLRGEIAQIEEAVASATRDEAATVERARELVALKEADVETERRRLEATGDAQGRAIVRAYEALREELRGFEAAAKAIGFSEPPALPRAEAVDADMGLRLALRAEQLRRLRHAQVAAVGPSADAVRAARDEALTQQVLMRKLGLSIANLKALGAQQAADAARKLKLGPVNETVQALEAMRQEMELYQKFYAAFDKNVGPGQQAAEFLASNAKAKQWMGDAVSTLGKVSKPAAQVLDQTDKLTKLTELSAMLESGDARQALKAMQTLCDLASSAPGFGGLLGKVMEASKSVAHKADALVDQVTRGQITRESALLFDRAKTKLYRADEIKAITNKNIEQELVIAVQLQRLHWLLKQ